MTRGDFVGKFADCRDCQHLQTWRCVRCTTGEFFEERSDEIDLDSFEFAGKSYDE